MSRIPPKSEASVGRDDDFLDGVDQLDDAFHRKIFALNRHQDFRRCVQGGLRQRSYAGRAINQNEVELLDRIVEMAANDGRMGLIAGKTVDILEAAASRQDEKVSRGTLGNFVRDWLVTNDSMVVGRFYSQRGGGIALRVHVDDQRAVTGNRQRGRKVDGGGGFSHASFLVDHTEISVPPFRLSPRRLPQCCFPGRGRG